MGFEPNAAAEHRIKQYMMAEALKRVEPGDRLKFTNMKLVTSASFIAIGTANATA